MIRRFDIECEDPYCALEEVEKENGPYVEWAVVGPVYDAAMARHRARRKAAESTWSREVPSPHGADLLASQEADYALDEACERAEEVERG